MFILLVEYVIYPWLASRGIVISEAKRIVFGFFCALLGALAAGILEMVRLGLIHSGDTLHQSVGGKVVVAANLSVLWQIPQYALIGLSEVFAVTTGKHRWPVFVHLHPTVALLTLDAVVLWCCDAVAVV